MKLNDTLSTGVNEGAENVTFYHVSTEVEAFKSFFREGAKSIGKGLGGQKNGFYVWTNKIAAEVHVQFLNSKLSNKKLENKEAVIVGVTVPKASISYPLWQQDLEQNKGLFELCTRYGKFLNEKARNLNIPLDKEKRPFSWPFEKITGFSFENENNWTRILFIGPDEKGRERRKICPDSPPWEADDSFKFQILTDWLCQNNPDFKKDYDKLMQKIMLDENGTGLKYTGSAPLAITSAEYVKINEDNSIKRNVIFDIKKGSNQVCPFLKMNSVRGKR